jgi:hypothetical protein
MVYSFYAIRYEKRARPGTLRNFLLQRNAAPLGPGLSDKFRLRSALPK